MKLIVLALALAVILGAGVLLLLSAGRERAATSRRLKQLTAPPPTKVAPLTGLNPDAPKGEPWIAHVPRRWREQVDDALGSTGYALTLRTYAMIAAGGGILFFLAAIALKLPIFVAVIALLIGIFFPTWSTLRWLQNRHTKRFLALFPDAIDLIVRAVRAGLPVAGALEATGRETPDPVGLEFRLITADMRIGLDLDEALHRANARIRLADFSFFVASLILQRESGGNLSETLSILSAVLRRRAELRLKIAAMTSEAKTSAYVIASLPFMASGALAFLNPAYISAFIVDPRGGYILGAAVGMLILGWLTMRTMIQNAAR